MTLNQPNWGLHVMELVSTALAAFFCLVPPGRCFSDSRCALPSALCAPARFEMAGRTLRSGPRVP